MSKIYRILSDGQTQIVDSPDELSMALRETAKSLRDLKLNNAQTNLSNAQADYARAGAEATKTNSDWMKEATGMAREEEAFNKVVLRLRDKYPGLNDKEYETMAQKFIDDMNFFKGVF